MLIEEDFNPIIVAILIRGGGGRLPGDNWRACAKFFASKSRVGNSCVVELPAKDAIDQGKKKIAT